MSRGFSLAGLLRVRGIQERAAAQRLSRAAVEADQTAARERRLRSALGATDAAATDVRALAALAASRVAGRALLADLATLGELQEDALAEARAEHATARQELRGLDRLAQAHARREREEQLRIEQAELDEIAARQTEETL